ncbi:MAG: energy-coupling factor ABC transporter permease [Anaerolineales bacterium]
MLYSPTSMHLPDGFLSPAVALVGWIIASVILFRSLRLSQAELGERQVPLMGILAAFIFAAQAVNFPVVAGTSGHLIGGTLAAVLLGPWAASLVMTSVIVLQALLFQDGGLLVMGWNILTMGILSTFVGYGVYRLIRRTLKGNRQGMIVGSFTGAWLSVVAGAMVTAVILALSGTFPLNLGLPAMSGLHALIGVGEGAITVATLVFLEAVRPNLVPSGKAAPGDTSAAWIAAAAGAVLVAVLLSPWASSAPDGLETVAEMGGFALRAQEAWFEILPDYTVPWLGNPVLTTLVAVGLGTIVMAGIGFALGRVMSSPEGRSLGERSI